MTETEMRQIKKRSRDAKGIISEMTHAIENYDLGCVPASYFINCRECADRQDSIGPCALIKDPETQYCDYWKPKGLTE